MSPLKASRSIVFDPPLKLGPGAKVYVVATDPVFALIVRQYK